MAAQLLRRLPAWVINGVSVTLGLTLVQCSISLVAGATAAQIAIANAVCASLADVVATTDRVARRVLVALVGTTAAATLFFAARTFDVPLVPVVMLLVFGAMLSLSWGPKAGAVAFATALSLVFAMSTSPSQTLHWDRFAWGLAGSAGYWIWAVVTGRLLQDTWRRLALAATADSLARLLAEVGRQITHPADAIWRSGIVDVEAALADQMQLARDLVFGNDRGDRARRQTAILLGLIDLRDLAMASDVMAPLLAGGLARREDAERAGHLLGKIAAALGVVGACLRSGEGVAADLAIEADIAASFVELARSAGDDRCSATVAVTGLLRSELDLLHAIQELLASGQADGLPCQRDDLRRYISPDEWQLAAVMANLRPDAPVFRHAVRTSLTAGLGYAVARTLPFTPHPQWVVLTVVAVMQGNLAQTLARRNSRVLGTLAGCLVVVVLTTNTSMIFLTACFLVASGVAHAFIPVRYSVTAACAAVMALLQAYLVAPAAGFGTIERFGDTVAGALLGWAATYVLPTWERRNLDGVLKQANSALRAYAAEAIRLREDPAALPRFTRQRAYDALRALNATRSRSLAEPDDVRVPIAQLTVWLAAAYGVMSHLSNLRLTLTLYAREHDTPALEAAVAEVARVLDATLDPQAPVPQQDPELSSACALALASVPNLIAQVRRALHDAARVSEQSVQIVTLLTPDVEALTRLSLSSRR